MSDNDDNQWGGLAKNGNTLINTNLNNLTIKAFEFRNQNDEGLFRPKPIKPALPTKIYHHGYYKIQQKNKKMLPGLSIKLTNDERMSDVDKSNYSLQDKNFARSTLRNTRNSQILNSLIQILKNDPDHKTNSNKIKNAKVKTEPSFLNQFIENRDISSVKNSRAPKIISNQIMMLGNQKGTKRKLVSEEKSRNKIFSDESFSLNRPVCKKSDAFDQMQMTFYKPNRLNANQYQNQNVNLQKLHANQFINDYS